MKTAPAAGTKNTTAWMVTALAVVVLAAVILLFAIPWLFSLSKATPHIRLADAIPLSVPGWQAKMLPLSESEEMRKAVENILHFDDAAYIRYTKPGVTVLLYAAYWKPGKVPYGLVGTHTPDVCWIFNGWQQVSRLHRQHRMIGPTALKPYEQGAYVLHDQTTAVIFWHLVGGESFEGYGMQGWTDGPLGYVERFPILFKSLRSFGLNLAREQMFVRISSDRPFAELWNDADFQRLILSLKPLGITS